MSSKLAAGSNPIFIYTDSFARLRALSFPLLLTTMDSDETVSSLINVLSLLAKTSCFRICLPTSHACILELHPLSNIFTKDLTELLTKSFKTNSFCVSKIPEVFWYCVSLILPVSRLCDHFNPQGCWWIPRFAQFYP